MGQVRAGLPCRVIGTDGVDRLLSVDGQAVRGQHHLARGPDLHLAGELLGLIDVHVTDEHVPAPSPTSRPRPQLGGYACRDIVEIGPAGLEEVQPPFQVRRREHLSLDVRRRMGDAPVVGRGDAWHPFHDLDVASLQEGRVQARPLGDTLVARPVRHHPVERVLLRRPPSIEPGPVHGTRDDPALLADLQDDPQRVGHGLQPTVTGTVRQPRAPE